MPCRDAGTDFRQARPIVNSKASKMTTRYSLISLIWKSRPDRGRAGLACSGVPEALITVQSSRKYNPVVKRCQIVQYPEKNHLRNLNQTHFKKANLKEQYVYI